MIGPLTPLQAQHADLLARWFRLHTEASQAQTGRKLRRLRAEIADLDHELAALERQIAAEAQSGPGGRV